ncbi:uncharacterized protein BO96DRAFT_328168 [Aspergillus niger CBS 101883]|uniref:uncharacterized protein n=1 Tax=Aspergillus lacticoffeatus (strain CBS 101883) TaxID=1450533 RepID=UPI000D7FE120|nr:uncharacterized protein BO96DRAFT_328168 [Aspergillus niger CBS 101883]PYH60815.1 hypothetical protein BO96DRAFT_328168 [Aspergillus niger CBS 101883]
MGGGRPVDDAQIAGAERLSNSSRVAITKANSSSHDHLRGHEHRSLRTQSVRCVNGSMMVGMKSVSQFVVARLRIDYHAYDPKNAGVVLVMMACSPYRAGLSVTHGTCFPSISPTKVGRKQNNPAYYAVYQSALGNDRTICRGVRPGAEGVDCLVKFSKSCRSQ